LLRLQGLALEEKIYFVCIMASRSRTIYTGVTNNLRRRVAEHKSGAIEGFTKRYRIHRLVYYERFSYIRNAISREKEIKGRDRAKRIALIEAGNPTWEDLAQHWYHGFRFDPNRCAGVEGQQIPRGLTPTRDDKS
jgi:putative endonuclease